jgi:ubiquinone/menaquinone biosynthesis C-methylase UbiE
MTFWDFCAPFYDFAERRNAKAREGLLREICRMIPEDATVLELAAGTGFIGLAVAEKAKSVLCTDVSKRMMKIADKKAHKRGLQNIWFGWRDIYACGEPDNAYDVVIAAQVLHLIDEPERAAAELKRIANGTVIVTVTLPKGLRGFFVRPSVGLWKLLGFAPKQEFDADSFREFLHEIGLPPTEFIVAPGTMPMAVAVWKKA